MEKKVQIQKRDILLFKYPDKKAPTSHLKNFIHFLVQQGISRPICFSHVEADGSLLGNLSLKENIHLDLTQETSRERNFCLEKFLDETKNKYLIDFFKKIILLEELPSRVDEQTCKMTVLFKSLIRPSDYLFLESPEKHLSSKNWNLFLKAMEYQRWHFGFTVLVYSSQHKEWEKLANKEVQCADRQKYIVRSTISSAPHLKLIHGQKSVESEVYLDLTNFKGSKKQAA